MADLIGYAYCSVARVTMAGKRLLARPRPRDDRVDVFVGGDVFLSLATADARQLAELLRDALSAAPAAEAAS